MYFSIKENGCTQYILWITCIIPVFFIISLEYKYMNNTNYKYAYGGVGTGKEVVWPAKETGNAIEFKEWKCGRTW